MRVSELVQKPDPYIGKEVTLTGVVHSLWKSKGEWDWYFADGVLQTEDEWPEDRMLLEWLPMPSRMSGIEIKQHFQQLEKLLLENVSLGDAKYSTRVHHQISNLRLRKIETILHYGNIREHLNYHWRHHRLKHLAYVFENSDDSWKTIEEPFIDPDVEAQLLELYRQIAYEKPKLLFSEIRDQRYWRNPLNVWLEGEITGRLEYYNGDFILKDAWKAVIPTDESTAHVVLNNQQDYLVNFGGEPSIPVRQILQNPQAYFGKQITVWGLFTSDFVEYEDEIRYARLVPNRLYYEYRSKWDNRVSLHLKMSSVTAFLYMGDIAIPGTIRTLYPNHNTFDVRLTGTLVPPENENSSIILDNITDLVSVQNGLIQHWKPDMLNNFNYWSTSEYFKEIREL